MCVQRHCHLIYPLARAVGHSAGLGIAIDGRLISSPEVLGKARSEVSVRSGKGEAACLLGTLPQQYIKKYRYIWI